MQVDRRPGDLLEVAPHEPVETAPVLCGSVPVVGPAGAHARKRRVLHHKLAAEAVARQCRPASAGSFASQHHSRGQVSKASMIASSTSMSCSMRIRSSRSAHRRVRVRDRRSPRPTRRRTRRAGRNGRARPRRRVHSRVRHNDAHARPVVASSRVGVVGKRPTRASACGVAGRVEVRGCGPYQARSSRFQVISQPPLSINGPGVRGRRRSPLLHDVARARHGDGRGATAVMTCRTPAAAVRGPQLGAIMGTAPGADCRRIDSGGVAGS